MFKKFLFSLALSSATFFLVLKSASFNFSLSLFFFSLKKDFYFFSDVGLNLDYFNMIFLFMVLTVTSLVSIYSEFYMEGYNNFKFFSLMLLFFSFMAILIFSSSPLILMLGWDGLGISSLCLILFYPNKTSAFNSFLTMMFNRIGDTIMILTFCLLVLNPKNFYFLICENFVSLLFLFVICSLTKSAQFPLSSWLPAAMSAPTPISAMVHSSTLVTAGLLLNFKLFYFYSEASIIQYLLFLSLSTFLIGGFLASVELDLKKMVAFSTMSQISMVMLFISLEIFDLAALHMFFHALFKTLLFSSCGLIFLSYFSEQMKLNFKISKIQSIIFFFFISIFLMSGVIFSSSFSSKDQVLENFMEFSSSKFSFLILGSVLTSFYCSKLFEINLSSIKNWPVNSTIKFYHIWMFFFSAFVLVSSVWMKKIFFVDKISVISNLDHFFLILILGIPLILVLSKKVKIFSEGSMDVFFMKTFSFSIFKFSEFLNFYPNDMFFFKPNLISKLKMNFFFSISNFFIFIFILILSFENLN